MEDHVEKRIDEIISGMTLAEKLGQMTYIAPTSDYSYEDIKEQLKNLYLGVVANVTTPQKCNELQRIAIEETPSGIPLIFGRDTIHGYRTIFPIPLAMASSWNADLMEKAAEIAAKEASSDGINLNFAPMMDIARDSRWGRIMEAYSEDPYLSRVFTRSVVRGYQGDDISDPERLAACAKHFVGQGAAVGGRDYGETDITERTLREIYFPSFKEAIDAGVASIMSEFNDIGGVPCTGNRWLLDDVLRKEWGFDGIMFSDWNSVTEMIEWGYAADEKEAAEKAIHAGADVEMYSRSYIDHAEELLNEGKISGGSIDEAVRRILRIKIRMGLFENPYKAEDQPAKVILHQDHLAFARRAAAESAVLLRNEKGLLPLSEAAKRIALIGPLADDGAEQIGNWTSDGHGDDSITYIEGLKTCSPKGVEIRHVPGMDNCLSTDTSGFADAVEAAEEADVVVAVVGEPKKYCGEAKSRAYLDLPGAQQELLEAVAATGKPVIVVLQCGRPMALPWVAETIPAILVLWHAGTMAGPALADLLWGRVNPAGKVTATWPRTVGQVPLFYNHRNTGRPPVDSQDGFVGTSLDPVGMTAGYQDCSHYPQYPFGYGLSYTDFEYAGLSVSPEKCGDPVKVEVSVEVTNTGPCDGIEIVQLYIRDTAASASRPVKELKAYERVILNAGETEKVRFVLTEKELAFWNGDMRYVAEPGEFKVFVGTNSAQVLEGGFRLECTAPIDVGF
jgi:beta-glucosidase